MSTSQQTLQDELLAPWLIPGIEFTKDPEAVTRPGNGFTEKLHPDYHNNSKTGYHIPFVPIGHPSNRKLKVITIGAGFAGIMLAYNIEKNCSNVEHIIYEKNPTVGGTWYQNKYPNAACDAPTCTYQANFALAPDWESFYAGTDYLRDYLDRVVTKLDLAKYMTFNSRVIEARFDERKGTWTLKIEQRASNGDKKIFEDECDLLLGAVGILDRWEYPKIPGLNDFSGRVIHTADREKWSEYTEEKWKDQEVVVLGSGSSAYQVVPGMQPHARTVHSFLRTPSWFHPPVESPDSRPEGYSYTVEEKELFSKDPSAMLKHAKANENTIMMLHHMMIKHNPSYYKMREILIARTRERIKDEKLLEKLIPTWSPGCRRITPGDPFTVALQKPNVVPHFTGVASVVKDGVIDDDGNYTRCDTIVCATGFDVTYRPPFPLLGLENYDLRKEWHTVPASYFGIMAPKIPNYLMYLGPNSPVENGSITGILEALVNYSVKVIKKMQRDNIRYFVPRQDVTDDFNEHTQSWFKGTVWEEECNAWYKNKKTGRVDAIWPGSVLHYRDAIEEPRWEDMELKYHSKNRFQYLGVGYAPLDLNTDPDADRTPHLQLKYLDPRFYQ